MKVKSETLREHERGLTGGILSLLPFVPFPLPPLCFFLLPLPLDPRSFPLQSLSITSTALDCEHLIYQTPSAWEDHGISFFCI